jgi:ATP-dependent RNA helicase DDX49/DBP8
VFDEADRILTNESFEPDLSFIMEHLAPQADTRDGAGRGRQTFLFSATMSSDYDRLISKNLLYGTDFNPKHVVECGEQSTTDETFTKTVEGLKQEFMLVPQKVKEAYLVHTLKTYKLKKTEQCIIFTSTCRNCHFLALLLRELGYQVALIHS